MNKVVNCAETIENNDSTFVCVQMHANSDMRRLIDLWQHLKTMLNLDNRYVVLNSRELCIRVDGGMGFSLNEFRTAVASSEVGNEAKVDMFNLFYENDGWVRYYYTTCNICGQAFNSFDKIEDYAIHKERCGYGSRFDGDELDMHICLSCMNNLIDKCKVSPIMVNNL